MIAGSEKAARLMVLGSAAEWSADENHLALRPLMGAEELLAHASTGPQAPLRPRSQVKIKLWMIKTKHG
jgi:hypothetical protein